MRIDGLLGTYFEINRVQQQTAFCSMAFDQTLIEVPGQALWINDGEVAKLVQFFPSSDP